MSLRTPLRRVRGLGSAKEGVGHFWHQRVSAVALIPLVLWFIVSVFNHAGDDFMDVRPWLAQPTTAIPFLLLILVGCYHMRLGLQVVIEDYIHVEGGRIVLVILNNLFSIALAVATAFAVLKISLVP